MTAHQFGPRAAFGIDQWFSVQHFEYPRSRDNSFIVIGSECRCLADHHGS